MSNKKQEIFKVKAITAAIISLSWKALNMLSLMVNHLTILCYPEIFLCSGDVNEFFLVKPSVHLDLVRAKKTSVTIIYISL